MDYDTKPPEITEKAIRDFNDWFADYEEKFSSTVSFNGNIFYLPGRNLVSFLHVSTVT